MFGRKADQNDVGYPEVLWVDPAASSRCESGCALMCERVDMACLYARVAATCQRVTDPWSRVYLAPSLAGSITPFTLCSFRVTFYGEVQLVLAAVVHALTSGLAVQVAAASATSPKAMYVAFLAFRLCLEVAIVDHGVEGRCRVERCTSINYAYILPRHVL